MSMPRAQGKVLRMPVANRAGLAAGIPAIRNDDLTTTHRCLIFQLAAKLMKTHVGD